MDNIERAGDEAADRLREDQVRRSGGTYLSGITSSVVQIGDSNVAHHISAFPLEELTAFVRELRRHADGLAVDTGVAASDVIEAVDDVEADISRSAWSVAGRRGFTFLQGVALGVAGNGAYAGLLEAMQAVG